MHAKLVTRSGELAGLEFLIGHDGATLGRAAGAEITLPAQPISAEHARIRYDEESQAFFLEDLGSTNGTRLDGVAVEGEERLGSLHVITLAKEFDFVFQALEGDFEPAEGPPTLDLQTSGGTVVDGEVPTLPLNLQDEPGEPAEPADGTRIEEIPVVLPTALAAAADDAAQAPEPRCALAVC